jgi:alkylated DNA repair protein alkB family protein 1
MPSTTPCNLFKPLYKQHRHLDRDHVAANVLDPHNPGVFIHDQYSVVCDDFEMPVQALTEFLGAEVKISEPLIGVITVNQLPGLKLVTNMIPAQVQQQLTKDVITEYIPPRIHLSNLDLHYNLPRPLHIFDREPCLIPNLDPTKDPITLESLRNKYLRWVTLGGQYNWTSKEYPTFEPGENGFPEFPVRLARLLHNLFNIKAEAAIVNFYSPGDILSSHQDVAELSDADLVSISMGCDCIFYVGMARDENPLAVLLRSGDIVVMGGQARHAFHGVGKVWGDTCPDYLCDDPQLAGWDSRWSEWIQGKRININVRQML